MAEDTSETANLNPLKEVPKREEESDSQAIVIVPTEDGAEVRVSMPPQSQGVSEMDTTASTSTTSPIESNLPCTTLKVEKPDGEVPDTQVPKKEAQSETVPETTVPETSVQETTVPETAVQETTVPETAVPETSAPTTEEVDGDETEIEDAVEQDEPEEDVDDEWQPTPRKRGRQPSNDLAVFMTAVLPETSSCMNLKSSYAEQGLGIPPIELKGTNRVRSKLPLTWAAGDLEAYIRGQFPILREYELLRTGPAKSLVLLPPEANTPALLRHELGRSGLYIRPKGTLADMGLTEPVVTRSPPKKKPVISPGEKRRRGRPTTQMFAVNMLAVPSDIRSLASVDYDLLKQQGFGVPDGEISGPFQQKTQLPLKWNSSELDEFIRRSYPRLKKYELLRATPGRQLDKLPRKVNTPSALKANLGRQVLCIRAVGPLNPLPKRRHTKTRSHPQVKIQATSENVDKLKNLIRDNFQSVLGSTIEYHDQLSVKASISLIVDTHNTLNFSVSHSWSSEEVLSAGREGPESVLDAEPLWIKNEPAASLLTGADVALPAGDGDEDDAEDGGHDSDATYIDEDNAIGEITMVESMETADAASPAEEKSEKSDPDFMPASLPVKRGRGRPRKDGSSGPPGPKRTYTPRGSKTRVPGERKVYQRKKMEEPKEEPWDAEKVEAYLNQAQRKLTRERVEKYGDVFRNALKAVKTQKLTVRAAATKFNIPYGILWEEVNHSRFQCKVCKKTYAKEREYDRHMASHVDIRQYPCTLCNKAFRVKKDLERHQVVHGPSDRHVCHICGEAFRWSAGLQRHLMKHNGTRGHTCMVCGKAFFMRFDLLRHTKLHTGVKDFICTICGMQFPRTSQLNAHMNTTHQTERNHVCEVCQKAFKTKHALLRHMRFHSDTKQYTCPVCGEGFKWHTSRKLHMKKHQANKMPPQPSQQPPQPQQQAQPKLNSVIQLQVHQGLPVTIEVVAPDIAQTTSVSVRAPTTLNMSAQDAFHSMQNMQPVSDPSIYAASHCTDGVTTSEVQHLEEHKVYIDMPHAMYQ